MLKTIKLIRHVNRCNFCTSIDREELTYFEKQASHWWSESKSLQTMNKLRVPFIRDNLLEQNRSRKHLNEFKLIEVGCGGGILTEPLARLGANLTAIDPSSEMIKIAKSHRENLQIDYQISTLESFIGNEQNRQQFDAVIVSEVIEHVIDPDAFLKNCSTLLKPNGSIFITTINKTLTSLFAAILMAEYVLGIVPKRTHDWNKFLSPAEIETILNRYDFDVLKSYGMGYNFLTQSWFWTSNTAVNFALFAVKN